MRTNTIGYIIAASSLALIALVVFQVNWLNHSRNLIEEQFDQKVRMAMCYAIDNAYLCNTKCNTSSTVCAPYFPIPEEQEVVSEEASELSTLDSSLMLAMSFYDIKPAYDISIGDDEAETNENKADEPYTCALSPMDEEEDKVLKLQFRDKEEYIFGEMKFMFISFIAIVLFITAVFIFANYTLLKQKRLGKKNKDFFNGMAHEFRTPLANIKLAGKLLSKSDLVTKDQKYLDIIRREGERLEFQVNRVLYLSKLKNGQCQLEKEAFCPHELMAEVISGMDIQIQEKNATVRLRCDQDDVPQLLGDTFHLGNAFRNLIDNALKYARTEVVIDIDVRKENDGVLIHVQDNGKGISIEDQNKIFDRYERGNNDDSQIGFGMGLAYVKMIIEQHKGFIKMISKLNQGTQFDLFLPTPD